jgi:hypothetical protein
MTTNPPDHFEFDVFISYSHADRKFAERLEEALEKVQPPADLGLPDSIDLTSDLRPALAPSDAPYDVDRRRSPEAARLRK